MSEERKKPSPVFQICVAAAIAAVILAGYIGMYALMVRPTLYLKESPSGVLAPTGYSEPLYLDNPDTTAENVLTAVFSPAHEIDRRVRPTVWGERH